MGRRGPEIVEQPGRQRRGGRGGQGGVGGGGAERKVVHGAVVRQQQGVKLPPEV
jgi:hypothetical protein